MRKRQNYMGVLNSYDVAANIDALRYSCCASGLFNIFPPENDHSQHCRQ